MLGRTQHVLFCDRSDFLHPIHGGPDCTRWKSPVVATSLCWRHPDIYGSCSPSHVDMFLATVTNCVNAVADWMQSNRLQLNDNKMGVHMAHNGPSSTSPAYCWSYHWFFQCDSTVCGSWPRHLHWLGPVNVQSCHTALLLHQLRTIWRQVPTAVFESMIIAPVLPHLRLPYQLVVWFAYVLDPASTVYTECRRAAHIWYLAFRAHHSCAH